MIKKHWACTWFQSLNLSINTTSLQNLTGLNKQACKWWSKIHWIYFMETFLIFVFIHQSLFRPGHPWHTNMGHSSLKGSNQWLLASTKRVVWANVILWGIRIWKIERLNIWWWSIELITMCKLRWWESHQCGKIMESTCGLKQYHHEWWVLQPSRAQSSC